ncbi:sensor histidine kinase [Azospirillum halopraeferens]|uniref:sensor histidine kinase n=1 Tax=Azospirillum halopraeferens TaxID=34010 RepID=UPI000419752A|nr:histidine kinase dimerization/phosphoacceptor domain -containing protein [Azospirillum halopraeferens]
MAGRTVVAALTLVALLFLLALLLTGLFIWQGHRDARAAVHARAASAAYSAAAHARWLVEANLQALRRVAESVGGRPEPGGEATIRDLSDAVAALPGAVPIWVFDANGDSVLSNEPQLGPANAADRSYFRALRDGQEWHIGPLLVGALSGRKIFPIGHRLERDGRFAGAVVVFVPADPLAEFWESMQLGPGSTVGLLRDDGWLVARHPVPDRAVDLSGYVLFTRYLPESPHGVYEAAASPADGVSRLVGYRRVDGLPLVAVVGIPASTLAASARQRMGEVGLILAPVGLGLLLVSVWVVRLLRREEHIRRALSGALEDNRVLLREVHHRVKNNLQTVSALVQLQPGPAEGKEDLMRRIAAMAAVHEHIYGSDRFDGVDVAEYVRTLVMRLREGYGSAAAVHCALDPVAVDPDKALPLGLIVNEVVSNAFKHAFPDGRDGSISVTLQAVPGGPAVLRVHDDGVGYTPDGGSGMGSRLIRSLAAQIGGTVEFRQDGGTLFALTFPLRRATDEEPAARAA